MKLEDFDIVFLIGVSVFIIMMTLVIVLNLDRQTCQEQLNDKNAWGDFKNGRGFIAHSCCTTRQKIVGDELISYDYCEDKQ